MKRFAALLVLTACASAPPKAPLVETWPQADPGWKQADRSYSRHGSLSKEWNLLVDVVATLKTPRWRAAYVAEWRRRTGAAEDAAARLADAQQQAAAAGWEVELLLATNSPSWNDLAKKERSMWRLVLVGDDGREVTPTSVQPDKRPKDEILAWHPKAGPFHRAYIVVFPRKTADGRELVTGKKVTLKMGAGLGSVELVWEAP
jgi:hypothetical protein